MTNVFSSGLIDSPHRGVETWVNPHAIRIFRLHYTADDFKATPEWITREKASITDPQNWEREYEINAKAKLGQQIYQLDEIATLEKSFVIPEHWTRYFALDPHPRVPHGSLWAAVDPYGDIWIYRELWPSRVHGKPGNIPEDDNRYSIKDYVAAVRWLESKDNPENDETRERIWRRVIDYAARAFGKGTTDDEEQPNFQVRFEEHMSGRCECKCESITSARFEDAKKDHEIGIACVNEWLKPLTVEVDGKPAKKSRLHIFADRCPELIYELRTNRYKRLTPAMADQHDPSSLPVEKRNHLTDCLRYLCMAKPEFVPPVTHVEHTWQPLVKGVAF